MTKKSSILNETKKYIFELKQKTPSIRYSDIIAKLQMENKGTISKSAISKILKKKDTYLSSHQLKGCRLRPAKEEQLELELYNWIRDNEKTKLIINKLVVIKRTKEIAEELEVTKLTFSDCWL